MCKDEIVRMPWSDAFSSLPTIVRGTIAVFVAVPAIAIVSYVGLVVVPTVPAIVEAIKQGRSATLLPLGIGEYEPPIVKKCKIVVENTNDSLHSLQAAFDKNVDLLKQQQIILQDATNKRSEFMQLNSEKIGAMGYTSKSILQRLYDDVQSQQSARDEIVNKLENRIEVAIDYLNRIRDYCLNQNQS